MTPTPVTFEPTSVRWGIIDLETTGVDPNYDTIIDIGFLEFEGSTLVQSFSSLVRTPLTLPHFIQHLTGLQDKMLQDAPTLEELRVRLHDFFSRTKILIAHNAEFEESFLKMPWLPLDLTFIDSIPFLSMLFPEQQQLALEKLLQQLGVACREEHRALSDVYDLLRVMLLGAYRLHDDDPLHQERRRHILSSQALMLSDTFRLRFLHFTKEELLEIAKAISFDLKAVSSKQIPVEESFKQNLPERYFNLSSSFDGKNVESLFRRTDIWQKISPHYYFSEEQIKLALKNRAGLKK